MSPPASLSSTNVSFASNEDESKYLKRTRQMHWIRIILANVILAIALVVIACEAHPLHYYHQTVEYKKWGLFLWPEHLDVRPSVALITCGVFVFVTAVAYVVAALLPSPRPRTTLLNYLSGASALVGLIAASIAIAISAVFVNPHELDGTIFGQTIRSWTCTWADTHAGYEFTDRNAQPETIHSVNNFNGLCMETTASFALMIILIVFEFGFCVLAGVGFWLEMEMGKKRSIVGTSGDSVNEHKTSVSA